jgi:hypothetical protein
MVRTPKASATVVNDSDLNIGGCLLWKAAVTYVSGGKWAIEEYGDEYAAHTSWHSH